MKILPVIFKDKQVISTTPLEKFLTIEDLSNFQPDLQSPNPFGRLKAPRGEMVYLNGQDCITSLGVLEIRPELGPHGRHMHRRKKEIFYIITGQLQGRYWHENDPKKGYVFNHHTGHFITIQPGLFHELAALEPTWTIEFLPQIFDITDTIYPQETPFDS